MPNFGNDSIYVEFLSKGSINRCFVIKNEDLEDNWQIVLKDKLPAEEDLVIPVLLYALKLSGALELFNKILDDYKKAKASVDDVKNFCVKYLEYILKNSPRILVKEKEMVDQLVIDSYSHNILVDSKLLNKVDNRPKLAILDN